MKSLIKKNEVSPKSSLDYLQVGGKKQVPGQRPLYVMLGLNVSREVHSPLEKEKKRFI